MVLHVTQVLEILKNSAKQSQAVGSIANKRAVLKKQHAIKKCIASIKTIQNSKMFPDTEKQQILSLCSDFLTKKEPLFLNKISKEEIVDTLLKDIMTLDTCTQGELAICGPFSAIIGMIARSPAYYLNNMFEYARTGEYISADRSATLPYYNSNELSKSEDQLDFKKSMILAFKQKNNWLPYYINWHYYYQYFINSTRPSEMVKFMQFLGYSDIIEAIRYPSGSANKELNVVLRFIIGGLYSNKHHSQSTKEALFDDMMKAYQAGKAIIINEECPDGLKNQFDITHFLGIPITHYMYVKQIEERGDSVYFTYYNTQHLKQRHQLKKSEFLKIFSGYIAGTPPKLTNQMQNQLHPTTPTSEGWFSDMTRTFLPQLGMTSYFLRKNNEYHKKHNVYSKNMLFKI